MMEKHKLVVRNLPVDMSKEEFVDFVDEKFSCKYDYFYFVNGVKKLEKRRCSWACINFPVLDDLNEFIRDFNGLAFVSGSGEICRAHIEYSPYQSIPRKVRKPNRFNATLTKDKDFQEFLEKFSNSETQMQSEKGKGIGIGNESVEEPNATSSEPPPKISLLIRSIIEDFDVSKNKKQQQQKQQLLKQKHRQKKKQNNSIRQGHNQKKNQEEQNKSQTKPKRRNIRTRGKQSQKETNERPNRRRARQKPSSSPIRKIKNKIEESSQDRVFSILQRT